MGHTNVDYASTSLPGDPSVLKALIQANLIGQQAQTISYPMISGQFVAGDYTLDIQTLPNSNTLVAQQRHTANNSYLPSASTLSGIVETNGTVQWSSYPGFPEMGGPETYVEDGQTAYLRTGQWAGWNGIPYVGKATGQKSVVTWYDYFFTPQMTAQMAQTDQGVAGVRGGVYEVSDVSDLRLTVETQAIASFSWRASLNDLGRLFLRNQVPAGTGHVAFNKKPDGTWMVSQWCAANCRF